MPSCLALRLEEAVNPAVVLHSFSIREVAAHFHAQVSTVSRVYQRLEQEGLLSRVRGSKTVLQGLHFDRHLSVRAFVGLTILRAMKISSCTSHNFASAAAMTPVRALPMACT